MKLVLEIEAPIGSESAGNALAGKIKKGIEAELGSDLACALVVRAMIREIKVVDYKSIDTSEIT